mmetsp:Transcript_34902/g.57503  ORF Transcript_34902/g.57503 Transcript_34902/m.57503 type:complete len:380 (+) Transcript_34902:128-1267(+)
MQLGGLFVQLVSCASNCGTLAACCLCRILLEGHEGAKSTAVTPGCSQYTNRISKQGSGGKIRTKLDPERPLFAPALTKPDRTGGESPSSSVSGAEDLATGARQSMDCSGDGAPTPPGGGGGNPGGPGPGPGPGEAAAAEAAEAEQEELVEEEFDPYVFMKTLPPYHEVDLGRPACLPPRRQTRHSPPCLVLDLDETLVHCTVDPITDADHVFTVRFNEEDFQVHVRCRPHLKTFLRACAENFEVVVFTASQRVYADALLDILDPHGAFVKHRLFREACLPVDGNFIKDLQILGRDLSKTILVDNSPYAFGYQIDNGIPIESWFDDPNDEELLKLLPFLEELRQSADVRPLIRDRYRTHELVERARVPRYYLLGGGSPNC